MPIPLDNDDDDDDFDDLDMAELASLLKNFKELENDIQKQLVSLIVYCLKTYKVLYFQSTCDLTEQKCQDGCTFMV